MPFLIIKGTFHPELGQPDGDSVRFEANKPEFFKKVKGKDGIKKGRVEINTKGKIKSVQLRYEGIDALEKAAIAKFSQAAIVANISSINGYEDDEKKKRIPSTPGYILTKNEDGRGRPVCLVFYGSTKMKDGSDNVFVDAPLLRKSVNYLLMDQGQVFPMYYRTFYGELKNEMNLAYFRAKKAKRGMWKKDWVKGAVTISRKSQLATINPIFPKLWRRLEDWLAKNDGLGNDFHDWIERKHEKLTIYSESRDVELQDIIEVKANKIRLLKDPSDLGFTS